MKCQRLMFPLSYMVPLLQGFFFYFRKFIVGRGSNMAENSDILFCGFKDVAMELEDRLKNINPNRKIFCTETDKTPGEQNDVHAYEDWKVVIFYFSDNSSDNEGHIEWFCSMQRMHDNNRCNIIVVKEENAKLPLLFWGWPIMHTRTRNSGEEFWNDIIENIKNPPPVVDVFPVGDVAQGFAWNYYYGYLRRILKGKDSFIKQYQHDKMMFGEHAHTLDKLIILLPKSCKCKDSLNEYDSRVKYLKESAISDTRERAGQPKIFLQAVYEISCKDQTYVVLLDVPNIITTIGKMEEHPEICFKDTDIDREYKKFKRFLEQAELFDDELRDKFIIVEFDDSKPKTLAEQIVKGIDWLAEPIVTGIDCVEVYCAESDRKDNTTLKAVEKAIKDTGIMVLYKPINIPGTNMFGKEEQPRTAARKQLILITGELSGEEESFFLDLYTRHVNELEKKNQLSLLLPIVTDTTVLENMRFQYLKHINCLSTQEPDFLKKVAEAVTGDSPLCYPLGNLATGLAWTYCLNYLELCLGDFNAEYHKLLEADSTSVKFPFLIILLPTSCHAPDAITQYDKTIERNTDTYKEELLVKKTISGKERRYNIPINRVELNGKVYKVMVEFATPLAALSETEIGMKTQLSREHKLKQRERFDDLLANLVEEGTRRRSPLQYCRLLKFEDNFEDETRRIGPKFNLSKLIADMVDKEVCQVETDSIEAI